MRKNTITRDFIQPTSTYLHSTLLWQPEKTTSQKENKNIRRLNCWLYQRKHIEARKRFFTSLHREKRCVERRYGHTDVLFWIRRNHDHSENRSFHDLNFSTLAMHLYSLERTYNQPSSTTASRPQRALTEQTYILVHTNNGKTTRKMKRFAEQLFIPGTRIRVR